MIVDLKHRKQCMGGNSYCRTFSRTSFVASVLMVCALVSFGTKPSAQQSSDDGYSWFFTLSFPDGREVIPYWDSNLVFQVTTLSVPKRVLENTVGRLATYTQYTGFDFKDQRNHLQEYQFRAIEADTNFVLHRTAKSFSAVPRGAEVDAREFLEEFDVATQNVKIWNTLRLGFIKFESGCMGQTSFGPSGEIDAAVIVINVDEAADGLDACLDEVVAQAFSINPHRNYLRKRDSEGNVVFEYTNHGQILNMVNAIYICRRVLDDKRASCPTEFMQNLSNEL